MPYFHATFRESLASIQLNGLGGRGHASNWPDIERGVYLASTPALAMLVMVDHYLEFGDPQSVPRDYFERMVIIIIDDARVDRSRLTPDPLLTEQGGWLYKGVIDVASMPAIPFLDIDVDIPGASSPPRPLDCTPDARPFPEEA